MRFQLAFSLFTALFLVMHNPVAKAQVPGEKIDSLPKLYVLAVGVNDYDDSRLTLSYAVPDAKALGDALKKAGSSMYQSVEVTSVLDDSVTIDNLDKVFVEVSSMAGHGKTVDGRFYFLPQNFRYEDETSIVKHGIDQDRFHAWFGRVSAHNSILLYEMYESGAHGNNSAKQLDIQRVAAIDIMSRQFGKCVIVVSSENRVVDAYQGLGLFTRALLDALATADSNGNGRIEVSELVSFISEKVPDLSFRAFKFRQLPQTRLVGNDFALVSTTATPKRR